MVFNPRSRSRRACGERDGKMKRACICNPKDKSKWWVMHRRHNHSAFESPKYHEHYSTKSTIVCEGCGMVWRTDAAYVNDLPDQPEHIVDKK